MPFVPRRQVDENLVSQSELSMLSQLIALEKSDFLKNENRVLVQSNANPSKISTQVTFSGTNHMKKEWGQSVDD